MKDARKQDDQKKAAKTKKVGAGTALMFFAFVLMGGLCGVFLGTGMEKMEPADDSLMGFVILMLEILAMFLVVMIIQIAIHEGGHWLFGRMTGYRFVSYRLFSFMWIRDGGKIRFCRFSLAGTGGQCLMDPPDLVDGQMPVTLYNLGGPLVNLFSALVAAALAFMFRDHSLAYMFFGLSAIVGFGYALMNGLPMRTNMTNNDGMNALELRHNAAARRAFFLQMRINACITRGMHYAQMPEAWFEMPRAEDMGNSLVASLPVLRENRLMEQGRFQEAAELIDGILAAPGAMPGVYVTLLRSDRAYIEWVGENGQGIPKQREKMDTLLTEADRKLLKQLSSLPEVLRTEYTLALLEDRDEKAAKKILDQFEKRVARYPYHQTVETERRLLALAAEKANSVPAV